MLRVEQLTTKLKVLKSTTLELQQFLHADNSAGDPGSAVPLCDVCYEDAVELSEEVSRLITPIVSDITADDAQISAALNRVLLNSNITGRMDDIARRGNQIIRSHPSAVQVCVKDTKRGTSKVTITITERDLEGIYRGFQSILSASIAVQPQTAPPDICSCGSRMDVNSEESQYICPDCGIVAPIDGVIFHEAQCYAQLGTKTRANDYSALRHCRDWIPKIFGEEKVPIPDSVIMKIKLYMRNRGIGAREISSAEKMRDALQDPSVSETQYNDHTTLLIKRVGGIGPKPPTETQKGIIDAKYNIIIAHYSSVAGPNSNVIYCPYFIYKIIENFFADVPDMIDALKFIHLQSPKTVLKHDKTYEKIVERTDPRDGFVYVPTDLDLYHARSGV